MSPYINLKSRRSYDEFAKKIIPIISYRSQKSENLEDSRYNDISLEKAIKSNKKLSILQNNKILEDIKQNISKKEYSKLKKLLKGNDKNLMKIINNFEKKFEQSDSVIIIETSKNCRISKWGYAKNDYGDIITVD